MGWGFVSSKSAHLEFGVHPSTRDEPCQTGNLREYLARQSFAVHRVTAHLPSR